jgi:hypothetical protein
MKVRPQKEWNSLTPAAKRKIEDVALNMAKESLEHDSKIILDLYIKMVCKTLHDVFGFGEKRLYLFLGNHKKLFFDQCKKVEDGTQIEYLDSEMAKIFRKQGYPKKFFDKFMGEVVTVEVE